MTASLHVALPARQATRDAALPGLAFALDAAAMGKLLADREASFRGDLAVRYVRYHPRHSALIAYEMTNGSETELFYGSLTAPGIEPLAGHERDAERDFELDGGRSGKRPAFLPEVPMVLRRFPHDPVLRRLPEVWSRRPLSQGLHILLGEDDGAWKLTRCQTVVVRYKPERRCVFQLNLAARERNAGRKRRLTLFGQVDGDGTGGVAAPVVAALASRQGTHGRMPVARPMLADPMLGLTISEAIAGSALPLHLGRDDAKKIVRRLAAHLVDIHRSGIEPSRVLSTTDRHRALGEAVATLAAVDEAQRMGIVSPAAALCDRLGREQPNGKAIASGCLHGDFHPGQVIVKGRRSWIVDFDRTATGDPLLDVAAFTTGLLIDASEGRMADAAARRAAKVFLRSYVSAWPEVWDPVRYAWHVSAALLEATVAPLRQLRAEWPMLVAERLRLAQAVRDGWVLP